LVKDITRAPDLDDARALLARARKHYAEFNDLVRPSNGRGLWQMIERRDPGTGEWFYRLHLDRGRLIDAKPIIADSATNIASALDHVAAALAKANGHDRLTDLHFPWGFADEAFAKKLAKVALVIGADMAKVLADARAKWRHEVHHVEAAKQISNTGKHWKLMFPAGSALAVALHNPGSQQIFEIQAGAFAEADTFEYHRGKDRLPLVPSSVVVGLRLGGLDEGLPNSPDSVFDCSFRFVQGVIDAVDQAACGKLEPQAHRNAQQNRECE
jgi:hypothetical protein